MAIRVIVNVDLERQTTRVQHQSAATAPAGNAPIRTETNVQLAGTTPSDPAADGSHREVPSNGPGSGRSPEGLLRSVVKQRLNWVLPST